MSLLLTSRLPILVRVLTFFWLIPGLCLADSSPLTCQNSRLSLPEECPRVLAAKVSGMAIVVRSGDLEICSFWPVRDLGLEKDVPRPGTLLGLVRFPSDWTDFKTQSIPKGCYSLRYLAQPKTRDHEETAPSPHFAVLIPVREERGDGAEPTSKEALRLSSKSTGGAHPAVMWIEFLARPVKEPTIRVAGKRQSLGYSWSAAVGVAFTLQGTWLD